MLALVELGAGGPLVQLRAGRDIFEPYRFNKTITAVPWNRRARRPLFGGVLEIETVLCPQGQRVSPGVLGSVVRVPSPLRHQRQGRPEGQHKVRMLDARGMHLHILLPHRSPSKAMGAPGMRPDLRGMGHRILRGEGAEEVFPVSAGAYHHVCLAYNMQLAPGIFNIKR